MPFQALRVRPGINTEASPLLNESGWSTSNLIRFFQSMLQKLGGWTRLLSTRVVGTARAMVFWEDANGQQYIGIGTEQRLEVYTLGAIYDITPLLDTSNLSNPFTTTALSTTVEITDASHGGDAAAGNWINVVNPAAIGGIIIQGFYTVLSIIDATHYNIVVPVAPTSSVGSGGTAALFTTTNTSNIVQVTLANHGYVIGSQYTVYISTTVATIVLFGFYSVNTIIDANNFTIIASNSANASTTGSENGGNIEIQYILGNGPASATNVPGLYGIGSYGLGPYGVGAVTIVAPPRIWSLGAWGTDMVASYTNGAIYAWITENGVINNQATIISQAPKNINAGIFVAMPEQQIVALGASVGTGTATDQLLIRWCDISDYTDWVASATNQAGSYRIPRGSHIVGGIQGPQQALIWTDIGIWAMQYIGFPLVYGFNELGEGCGLIGQNARGVLGGRVLWMSFNGFFIYDGNSVQPLPCSIWDKIFQNINKFQAQKILAAPNSYFNEMWFFWASASGNGEIDSYAKICMIDGSWDYGSLIRTAWLDQSSYLSPIGVDGNGMLQQHELGNDADGVAMDSFAETGWFKIAQGTEYTFLERLIPDFIYQSATLKITLTFANYPNGPQFVRSNLTATQATQYLIVRGRGRLVKIKIESNDLGSFWRLGEILYSGAPDGRN